MMKFPTLCLAGAAAAASAVVAAADSSSSSSGGGGTFGAYFANWAQYHQPPYNHVAADVAPIAGRTDEILFGFVYFCPPAGTSPMPYWAVTPYGSCTDDTEFQLMTVESNDAASMQTLAGFQGGKVIASVGGWNFPSSYFSAMVATSESRGKFITSAKSFLSAHGLAGIDIDWEYPCSAAREDDVEISCQKFDTVPDTGSTCPQDSNNFVQFLKELRAGLGADARITVASQAGDANAKAMGVSAESSSYVDAWHVMTYDYAVSDLPDPSAATMSPSAPLYNPPAPAVQMSINQTVTTYLALGAPKDKIMIGIPLYGHSWYAPSLAAPDQFGGQGQVQGRCCGVFTQTYGAQPGFGSSQCGLMMYNELQAALGPTPPYVHGKLPQGHLKSQGKHLRSQGGGSPATVYFDNATQSAIAYFTEAGLDNGHTAAGTWVTYSNSESIAAVTAYANENGLGGVFIFDTSMDTLPKGGAGGAWTFDLMNQIADAMGKPKPAPPSPSPAPSPGGSGGAPSCDKAGQQALCSVSCASPCRGFPPGFSNPGCVDDIDCTNPPSWAKGSVCTC